MNILSFLPILLLSSLVGGYSRYHIEEFKDFEELSEAPIERLEFSHTIGIEPFLRAHVDDPLALFSIFFDDDVDEYENIALPKRPGDSIIKVRKPQLKLLPQVKKHLIAFLRKKNIPELNNYIDKNRLDRDDDELDK